MTRREDGLLLWSVPPLSGRPPVPSTTVSRPSSGASSQADSLRLLASAPWWIKNDPFVAPVPE